MTNFPRTAVSRWWCLGVVLAAAPALADKLCVGPVAGPAAAGVQKQLADALCDSTECAAAASVTTAGKPDFKKGKKESVTAFLTGVVAKKGKAVNLTLTVVTGPGKPKATKTFALTNNALSTAQVAEVVELVKPYAPAPPKPAPPPAKPAAEPAKPAEPAKTTKTDTTPAKPEPLAKGTKTAPAISMDEPEVKKPVTQEKDADLQASKPAADGKKGPPMLGIELGVAAFNRHYDYDTATTGNLRKYDLPLFPAPRLGLDVTPLAGKEGPLSGLGLEAAIDYQAWLKSRKQNVTTEFPTSYVRWDVSARWRFPLKTPMPLAVTPRVGVRSQSFTVAAASDGTKLDGVPNLSYLGVRVGATAELGLLDEALKVWLSASVAPALSSGEVISSTWFAHGTNLGVDASLGAAYRVIPNLWVKVGGEFSNNALSFQAQPDALVNAKGATDRYLGFFGAVRYEL